MKSLILRLVSLLLGGKTAQCPICGVCFLVQPYTVWDWKTEEPVCETCEDNTILRNRLLYTQSKGEAK